MSTLWRQFPGGTGARKTREHALSAAISSNFKNMHVSAREMGLGYHPS
jgi:hypothetical protein